jgi:hypothetical protein
MIHTTTDCTTEWGIRIWRGLLIALLCAPTVGAAEGAPDLLGLRRLDAILASEAQLAETESAAAEQPFVIEPSAEGPEAAGEPSALSDDLLDWVNEFMQHQVLFRNSDLMRLRQALRTVPEDQLQRWADETQQLRQRLTGDSWNLTQQWLREFLAVQAIYSPEEIVELRRRMATLTASQLLLVLDHFETVHLARLRSGQASEQLRAQQLTLTTALRASPSAGRAASFNSRMGFPSSVGSQVPVDRDRDYVLVRRPSLSQRVSNYYINRSIFGRSYFWWFW